MGIKVNISIKYKESDFKRNFQYKSSGKNLIKMVIGAIARMKGCSNLVGRRYEIFYDLVYGAGVVGMIGTQNLYYFDK